MICEQCNLFTSPDGFCECNLPRLKELERIHAFRAQHADIWRVLTIYATGDGWTGNRYLSLSPYEAERAIKRIEAKGMPTDRVMEICRRLIAGGFDRAYSIGPIYARF